MLPPDAWAKRLTELDQMQAAEVQQAIKEAADLRSDVHLHRKIGSRFIGIGFVPGNGPAVKVVEHPEIAA